MINEVQSIILFIEIMNSGRYFFLFLMNIYNPDLDQLDGWMDGTIDEAPGPKKSAAELN